MTPFSLAVTLLTHDKPDYEQTLILFNNQTINLHTEKHEQCVENVYIAQNKYQKCVKLHIFSTSTIQYLLKKPQRRRIDTLRFFDYFLRIIVILSAPCPS